MKKQTIEPPKWYQDWEYTVHAVGDDRQVRVYYFPNLPHGHKVVQFQVYDQNDVTRRLANLLESALYELTKGKL